MAENFLGNKAILVGITALVVGVFLGGIFLSAPSSSIKQENIMERINTEGKIHACYIVYPPMVIKDPNTGNLSGHMIDAFNFIAEEAKLEVDYKEAAWGTFISALQSRQCDVVVTGLFNTIERAKSVSYTQPIMYIGNSVLIRKGDNRFKELEDFNNPEIKIAVIQGEVGHLYAQKHLNKAELIVLPGSDISLALAQVSAGRADAAFTDGWPISQYVKEHPETVDFLSINPDATYGLNPAGWAVRQENQDFLTFLNNSIDRLQAESKFLEFESNYGASWLRQPFKLEKS